MTTLLWLSATSFIFLQNQFSHARQLHLVCSERNKAQELEFAWIAERTLNEKPLFWKGDIVPMRRTVLLFLKTWVWVLSRLQMCRCQWGSTMKRCFLPVQVCLWHSISFVSLCMCVPIRGSNWPELVHNGERTKGLRALWDAYPFNRTEHHIRVKGMC